MQRNKLWFVALITLFAVSARAQNTFPASGNVGIGTTNPTQDFQIVGADTVSSLVGAGIPSFQILSTASPAGEDYRLEANRNQQGELSISDCTAGCVERLTVTKSGNVGIGTTGPEASLQIGNPSTAGGTVGAFSPVLQIFRSTVLNSTAGTDLSLASIGFATGNNVALGIHGFRASTGSTWTTSAIGLGMDVDNTTRAGANIWLNANGNVGIGTTTPAYLLDVLGQIHSSGGVVFPDGTSQTTAFIPANCGADYAESVEVTGDRTKYEPGDILVIDPNVPGKFLKSNQSYSTLVAGIYSTQPGFVGRLHPKDAKTDETEVPMAMIGRVPTKVTAENGPIKVGDLLVASSTLGHAMKGTDRSLLTGAVIGKALGSLDSGTGVIEVLVTLQ